MRILIVEDEAAIARGLQFNFEQEGYEPIVVSDGSAALTYFDEGSEPVDLVVLDLMLPGMSGYEICRAIRERDTQVPILVLSARTLSEDKMLAFDCGTDQYMTKPFALPELLSRVRNLLDRRTPRKTDRSSNESRVFRFDSVEVDFRAFEVRAGGETHRLTTMEMALLRYFIEHQGAVLSRTQILRDVWNEQADLATRTIDNFVLRLRRIIEGDPTEPQYLLSVRGTGYRFVAPTPENVPESGSPN